MVVFADLRDVTRKINNYDIDATAGGLWTDTTHFRVTVPANKRYMVLGGVVNRSVSGTLIIRAYSAADEVIYEYASFAAATGVTAWPSLAVAQGALSSNLVLDAGEYIEMVFGAAQGAAAYASCICMELIV